MRLLIVTSLYPPDIAPLAVYVKELATRLRKNVAITILAYAHIPEKIDGVRIIVIPKNILLPLRLFSFLKALWKEARQTDLLYVQNGASVELPVSIVGLFIHTPYVLRLGDPTALASAQNKFWPMVLLRLIMKRATCIIQGPHPSIHTYPHKTVPSSTPPLRPEILPFTLYPKEAFGHYERAWEMHLNELLQIFNNAT